MFEDLRQKIAGAIAPSPRMVPIPNPPIIVDPAKLPGQPAYDIEELDFPEVNTFGRGQQLPKYALNRPRPYTLDEITAIQAAEKLKKSPWTYGCVRSYTDCIPSIDIKIVEWNEKEQGFEPNRNHPAEEVMDYPNPYQSRHELMGINTTDMLTAGNLCTSILDKPSNKNETYRLEALHVDFVRPILNEWDLFAGYAVHAMGWSVVGLPKDPNGLISRRNMVHVKMINPNDPTWGLSPLQVISTVTDAEAAAIAWNLGVVENSAKTSMAFTTDMDLGEDTHKTLTQRLKDGWNGLFAGTPMVLSHGLKPVPVDRGPIELDFVNSDYLQANKICAALRVPPPVIGISRDARLATLVEYYKQFWLSSVVPFYSLMLDGYTRCWIQPRWGRNVKLEMDLSRVPALQRGLSEKIADGQKLMEMGYTLNEVNSRLELGMPETMTGNIRYMPGGMIPVYENDKPIEVNTPDDDEDEDVTDEEDIDDEEEDDGAKAFPANEHTRAAFWRRFENEREKHYGGVEKKATVIIVNTLEKVAKLFDKGKTDNWEALVDESLLEWDTLLAKTWKRVGTKFFDRQMNDLKSLSHEEKARKPRFWEKDVQKYVQDNVAEKVQSINKTTKTWIKAAVSRTQEDGDSIRSVAKGIREMGPQYSKARANTISRTEVIGASNYGNRTAARKKGVRSKQWITSRDARVRDSHTAIDGQIRGLNEPYSNGLMFPGDPNGSAKEIINCRCVEAYLVTN